MKDKEKSEERGAKQNLPEATNLGCYLGFCFLLALL